MDHPTESRSAKESAFTIMGHLLCGHGCLREFHSRPVRPRAKRILQSGGVGPGPRERAVVRISHVGDTAYAVPKLPQAMLRDHGFSRRGRGAWLRISFLRQPRGTVPKPLGKHALRRAHICTVALVQPFSPGRHRAGEPTPEDGHGVALKGEVHSVARRPLWTRRNLCRLGLLHCGGGGRWFQLSAL